MKSFIAKRFNSILVNLRYLRFKLLKYKENTKKICNTFDHNFKNIPLYIMRKVSLEKYYFVLYDCALTSKMSKMALKSFCDKTLHILWVRLRFIPSINSSLAPGTKSSYIGRKKVSLPGCHAQSIHVVTLHHAIPPATFTLKILNSVIEHVVLHSQDGSCRHLLRNTVIYLSQCRQVNFNWKV